MSLLLAFLATNDNCRYMTVIDTVQRYIIYELRKRYNHALVITMSTIENGTEKNAFSVLMTKKTPDGTTLRRTLSMGTEFVECPAGCGKRMLQKDINQHLDQCIRLQQNDEGDGTQASQSQAEESPPSSQLLTQPTSVLRCGNKKRRKVTCPSCQNSFPSALINLHLDQCVNRKRSPPKLIAKPPQSASEGIEQSTTTVVNARQQNALSCVEADDDIAINCADDYARDSIGTRSNDTSDTGDVAQGLSDAHVCENNSSDSQRATSGDVTTRKDESQHFDKNSAFATMMQHSKAMFGKKDKGKAPLHLSFHLDESLRVRLSYPMTVETEWSPPVWSVLMNVRDKFANIPDVENPHLPSPIKIEVTVSTDIPTNVNQPIRWVRHHSQLSVPVLKSILQKSIRRRKPMPAVRVAMELADKAVGELLRRLPVIMLEDSYLHPDINVLIWIMMAHTKDYQPSSKVMIRTFQIIYEIAACQWSDPLPPCESTGGVTLTSLFQRDQSEINHTAESGPSSSSSSSAFDEGTAYIWSMLVRAEYGGLKCDIQMLQQYAQVWKDRCCSSEGPPNLHQDTTTTGTTTTTTILTLLAPHTTTDSSTDATSSSADRPLPWHNVPTYLHQKSREQSLDRVVALCQHGVERLVVEDICFEGIDYHCSGIINALLLDDYLCGICYDLMTLAEAWLPPNDDTPTESSLRNERRRTDLEHILKVIIWNFSSSINRRRPLQFDATSVPTSGTRVVETTTTTNDPCIRYKELWNDLIASRVLEYQKKYVQQRMAR